MIPLNAAEAADMLKSHELYARRCRAQIEYLGRLQEVERERLARLEAEIAHLQSLSPPPGIGAETRIGGALS